MLVLAAYSLASITYFLIIWFIITIAQLYIAK